MGSGTEESMLVIVATPTLAGLEGFIEGLIDSQAEVAHTRSGMATLEMAKVHPPALVVVDSDLPDFKPFELVAQLARLNAAITTVVISGLPPDTFHDQAEGLGVLAQLSTQPAYADAQSVMTTLSRIL
jgi:CheY-like chemotaxis protein